MCAFRRSISFCLLLWLLAGAVQARDLSALPTQVRLTGPQTAEQLNFRLSRTVAQCPTGGSLFDCSGVLVRDVAAGDPATFWTLSAGQQQDFLLLRDDASAIKPQGKVGFVFQDRLSAIAQGKPYTATQAAGDWNVAVDNWSEVAPAGVAFEALYYDFADPDALLRAHNAQRAYFIVTGEWLPVLRYARSETGQVRFGFNDKEQLYYGYTVAARLNARYGDTRARCAGKPGEAEDPPYYCSGLLVRGTSVGDFHAWNPSPSSVKGNGVSFTWLRKDQKITTLAGKQGLIMAPSAAPVAHPLTLRCIYPYNAGTGGADDMCRFRGSCTPAFNTLETWMATYRTKPGASCAIDPSVQGVALNTAIRNAPRISANSGWNEWMIAAWPQNIGKQLPLESFFHSDPVAGLTSARVFQRDYLDTDHRCLPILRLDVAAPGGQVATYLPQDQSAD